MHIDNYKSLHKAPLNFTAKYKIDRINNFSSSYADKTQVRSEKL